MWYDKFEGKNRFFCNGRIMTGPDFTQLLVTLGLIFIPAGLFSGFTLPYFTTNYSIAIPIVFGIIILFCVSSLCATSWSDPGIIPRNLDYRGEDPNAPAKDANGLPEGYPFGVLKPLVYENYTVRGVVIKTKYCPTCKISRPPRSSHCGICNNCVDRFDHQSTH